MKLNIQLDVSYKKIRELAIKREIKKVRRLIEYFQKFVDFIDKDPVNAKRKLDVNLYHGLDIVEVRNTFARVIKSFEQGIDNCIKAEQILLF